MKLESIKSSKFEAFKTNEIADQKLILGGFGSPTCTGGGFRLIDLVPDKDGARSVYEVWDSDVAPGTIGKLVGGVSTRYFNKHEVMGACCANW